MWKRVDLVELDGLLAVTVGVDDEYVPEGHVALWFGDADARRTSRGGPGGRRPEVWTVPAEYVIPAMPAVVRH